MRDRSLSIRQANGLTNGFNILVNGHEFDAHSVDFDTLAQRNRMYAGREAEELQQFQAHAEECVREDREQCRLEAAHPEVRHPEARVS